MNIIRISDTIPDVFKNRSDIVSDIWHKNIEFRKGNNYLVEANSGTGKSSLLSFLYGYRTDFQGSILFDDDDISSFSIKQWIKIRNNSISLMWQDLRLFNELTALENVKIKNSLSHFQKKSTILHWFDLLGISEKIDTPVEKMSFGQQQRVALIRALCQPFDFIFMDEPVSHLDESNSVLMANIVKEEAKRQGAGIIVTSIGKRLNLEYDFVLNL